MDVKYIPSVCQSENPTFQGHVMMRVPSFEERYQFIEDSGIDVSDEGGLERKGSNFSIIRNMVKHSAKFYQAVELKRVSDGMEFKSFEDLSLDPDCDAILIEVAREVRMGFRPSPK